MKAHIVVLPGDGVGPEVTVAAVQVLRSIAEDFGHSFTFEEHLIGGISIETIGVPLSETALRAAQSSNAVLLGAVGGPRWDDPTASVRPEQGLLGLRKGLGVFANLRPVRPHPALVGSSPLKPELLEHVDMLVVRELTGGLYFGDPKGRSRTNGHVRAVDTLVYHDYEVERIARVAFQLAAKRKRNVTSVDKANVLESSRLWRETVDKVHAEFPSVTCEHMLVDTAAMQLIARPARFDVLVTENMFGDILTDEAAVLAGSMGMLPSASLGASGPGLYEPIHGSAPDIAGKGIANPVGAILSAAMLLRHSLHLYEEARTVEAAVSDAIQSGHRTRDIGGVHTTQEVTSAIIEHTRKARVTA